ncbi:hypothetical protein H5410_044638 [Solanum commersonii]|uniref:Uncharacterized protein n=1 Tax=Solanum commersonii TaxID=4109 RepID=A0A9J5XAH2_SOLCO|nr:hypothetical protein H5410_044638 [Solanum commersonii]
MSKKTVVTPRKSPLLVEGTYTDEVHALSFNILTQTPSPNIIKNKKKNDSNKRVSPINRKGKTRKGKNAETLSDSDFVTESKNKKREKSMNVEVAQSSKPSTRRSKKIRNQKSQHLKKTKKLLGGIQMSEDGAINESEVTGTNASKFGGPRIAKEHVPDTTNYPTPRPRTRNLK